MSTPELAVAPRSARRVSAFSALLRRLAREHATQNAPPDDDTPKVTTMAEAEAARQTPPASSFTTADLMDRLHDGDLLAELVPIVLVTQDGASAPAELAVSDDLPSDLVAEAYAAFSQSSMTLGRALAG